MKEHILIADDEKEILSLLRLYLENAGYRVSEALDGEAAYSLIQNEEFDLIFHALLFEPADTVFGGKTLDYSLFDYALTVGNARKRRFDAVSLDRKRVVARDPVLPRKQIRAVEQLGEGGSLEAAHFYIEPFGKPQPDITASDRREVAAEGHTTVDGFDALVAKRVDLLTEQALKPEQAGRDIFVFEFRSHLLSS